MSDEPRDEVVPFFSSPKRKFLLWKIPMSWNKMRIKVTRAEAKVCDMMDGNRRCQIKFLLFSLANVSAWILLLIFFPYLFRLEPVIRSTWLMPSELEAFHTLLTFLNIFPVRSNCSTETPFSPFQKLLKGLQSWEVLTFLLCKLQHHLPFVHHNQSILRRTTWNLFLFMLVTSS